MDDRVSKKEVLNILENNISQEDLLEVIFSVFFPAEKSEFVYIFAV